MGLLILALLGGIGYWIYLKQADFSPDLFGGAGPAKSADARAGEAAIPLSNYLPTELTALSAAEAFGPDTLSDKIDGKAELYLDSGFVSLHCQRFAYASDANTWIEVFVYDMGALRNAYAVYSAQRREDAKDLALGAYGYRTANSLFFVRGNYYVELVASTDGEKTMSDLEAFARGLAGDIRAGTDTIPELDMLPGDGLVKGSVALQIRNGLGFEPFTNLVVGAYRVDDMEASAFVARRDTPADAAALAKAYCDFLVANGGARDWTKVKIPNVKLYNMFGTYEAVFGDDRIVAGVHQAPTKAMAEQLAVELYARIHKAGP